MRQPLKTKIGIIVGQASGRILAEAFINFIKRVGEEKYGLKFEFFVNSTSNTEIIKSQEWYKLPKNLDICPFSTYTNADGHSPKKIKKETNKIIDLLDAWHKEGIKYVFRTAINADVLYKLRQKVKAIKVITSNFNNNKILIIRDEFQGFYANDKWKYKKKKQKIIGNFHFSKEGFNKLIEKASEIAEKFFIEQKSKLNKLAIYKHHLFDGYIKKWIKNIDKTFEILQPDTGNTNFLNSLINKTGKNILIIASNEFGDVIHEYLLNIEGKLTYKIALFTENYYLKYPNFIIYQTVHGSADDKEPENILPIATLRIAAKILSDISSDNKILSKVDEQSKDIIVENLQKNEILEKINNFNLYEITNKIIKSKI